ITSCIIHPLFSLYMYGATPDLHSFPTRRSSDLVGIQPLLTEYSSADYEGHTVTLKTPGSEEKIRFTTMAEDRIIPWSYPDFSVIDRKSTRLNSSHVKISYAVFCLKKKNKS